MIQSTFCSALSSRRRPRLRRARPRRRYSRTDTHTHWEAAGKKRNSRPSTRANFSPGESSPLAGQLIESLRRRLRVRQNLLLPKLADPKQSAILSARAGPSTRDTQADRQTARPLYSSRETTTDWSPFEYAHLPCRCSPSESFSALFSLARSLARSSFSRPETRSTSSFSPLLARVTCSLLAARQLGLRPPSSHYYDNGSLAGSRAKAAREGDCDLRRSCPLSPAKHSINTSSRPWLTAGVARLYGLAHTRPHASKASKPPTPTPL